MSAAPVTFPILPERKQRVRRDEAPDYLPARMVNEFVYCPRLFFYEWVEGLFRHSADTVEGAIQHEKVDKKATAMPTPEEARLLAQPKVHPVLAFTATDVETATGAVVSYHAGCLASDRVVISIGAD